jgi:aldehyde dehydrogenase (NAD+)
VIQAIYTERDSNAISFSKVSDLLLRLRKWYKNIPANLKLDTVDPPPDSYKRAVAVLHLHYWSTIILLTRSFLLNLVLKHTVLAPNISIGYQRMAKVCIDAAQKSVALFESMDAERPRKTISSLTTFDSTTMLRCVTVFMCAFRHTEDQKYKEYTDKCMEIARRMEQIGFAKMVARETPGHLEILGMGDNQTPNMDEVTLAHLCE